MRRRLFFYCRLSKECIITEKTNLLELLGKTVFISERVSLHVHCVKLSVCFSLQALDTSQLTLPPDSPSPHCKFEDFAAETNGCCATVLLENPKGRSLFKKEEVDLFVRRLTSGR